MDNRGINSAMKKSEFVFFLLLIAAVFDTDEVKAQEYKHESGGMLGISFYLGDANKTRLYLHPGFTGGILYRYNINFHWAAKANLLAGKVSGNTRDANTVFPLAQQTSFNRTFIDWGGQIEFNFLPFSDKFTYKDAKPYIQRALPVKKYVCQALFQVMNRLQLRIIPVYLRKNSAKA